MIAFTENSARVVPRMLGLLAIAAFLGFCALFQTDQPFPLRVGVGVVVAILGAVCLRVGVRLLSGRHLTVTLGPNGFRCENIAAEFVPWSVVTSMKEIPIYIGGQYTLSVVEVNFQVFFTTMKSYAQAYGGQTG
ncbi:hypothetical protein AU467_13020 [Mesorhizobium loti]|uniref:Uncharacterized protein n=1 Tax=Rhizobium loti TaxID=381 RepID=A0A101KWE7_RHILI|nr:hypothetical protein AU467_13020 [Mesorhizobium loti]